MRPLCLLAFLLSGCASDDWTRRDTNLELIYIAALAADAYTTTRLQYHPDAAESQPLTRSILGHKPSTSETWQYFATMGVAHYLIARALPEKWRPFWQGGGAAYHGTMAAMNCDRGYCSDYDPPPPCPNCQPVK